MLKTIQRKFLKNNKLNQISNFITTILLLQIVKFKKFSTKINLLVQKYSFFYFFQYIEYKPFKKTIKYSPEIIKSLFYIY